MFGTDGERCIYVYEVLDIGGLIIECKCSLSFLLVVRAMRKQRKDLGTRAPSRRQRQSSAKGELLQTN
jgi:hypothetical protein